MDDRLKAALQRDAEEHSSSLTAAALRAMRIGLGLQKPAPSQQNHDLEALAGTWSDRDLNEFAEAVEDMSKIDRELWS